MMCRSFGPGSRCSCRRVAASSSGRGRCGSLGRRIHCLLLHLGDLAHCLLDTRLHLANFAVYDVEFLCTVRDFGQYMPQPLKHGNKTLEFIGFRVYFE